MTEILDSNSNHSPLHELVEKYIALKRDSTPLDLHYFESELKVLGKSDSEIHALLIEMDDDADKEQLAGDGAKKAKRIFIFGLIAGSLGIVLSILAAMGILTRSGFILLPYGLVGGSFIAVGKAYAEMGLVKKRKKRRFLKYQSWN